MKRIVVLSGRIGSGKSSLAAGLHVKYAACIVKTHDIIRNLVQIEDDREALQSAGQRLDAQTKGKWLADELAKMDLSAGDTIVIDSARIEGQIEAIRDHFGRIVTHIHLAAPRIVLEDRYLKRCSTRREFRSYMEASQNSTEAHIDSLEAVCDVLIDTSKNTRADVLVRAAARIGFYQLTAGSGVDVIIGGEYGSEGKGNIASYLAPEYQYLIRVGGPNAGHKVTMPDYGYRSLPSGTLHAPKAKLLIGPGATLQVDQLLKEISECGVTNERLSIDPHAMIIEESDREAEASLVKGIGSTGQGGGYAAARRLMRSKLDSTPVRFARDVNELAPFIKPIAEILEHAYAEGARLMLEGTQGTGLSLYHGRYPFVTSRDTTASGTMAEAGIPPARIRHVIMVCRTYPIRVGDPPEGTSGFMEQPISWDDVAKRADIPVEELTKVEVGTVTKKQRRVGEFEWALFRKACTLNAPTDIALTFADYLRASNKNARRFEQLSSDTIRFVEELERVASAPVSLISTRFHARSIIDRRMW